jgi:murein DD-endopeptidase MepM/ murein hydrolase activator NlpD
MLYRSRVRHTSGTSRGVIFVGVLALALVAGLGYVLVKMISAPEPHVRLVEPFTTIGRNRVVRLSADDKVGLRAFKVTLEQGGTQQVLLDETYDPPRPQASFEWSAAQEKRFKLQEGKGTLKAEVRNASWGGFFRGRHAALSQEFTARLVPPRVEALTTQHYVNQGGCDVIVYRVTPAGAESGVVVGDTFFRGYPLPGATEPGLHFAIFGLPYDLPASTPMKLRARDDAGNEALSSFWLKVFPKKFRSRDIPVDDAFLDKVVPEILSQSNEVQDQGDKVKSYVAINRDLRKVNNARLAQLAAQSKQEFQWSEPFKQLGNSQVEAQFADHRTYKYGDKEIDRQDHLGFDLATTSHASITASNRGVVVLAEFFGIYGNTVVLDHGYGILSLYGHLSSIGVQPGAVVERGQEIGRSGSTGLAGGDHLHFTVVNQDVQVDPREWWDPHWIEDRLASKLRQFGSTAGPAKAAVDAAAPVPAAKP